MNRANNLNSSLQAIYVYMFATLKFIKYTLESLVVKAFWKIIVYVLEIQYLLDKLSTYEL